MNLVVFSDANAKPWREQISKWVHHGCKTTTKRPETREETVPLDAMILIIDVLLSQYLDDMKASMRPSTYRTPSAATGGKGKSSSSGHQGISSKPSSSKTATGKDVSAHKPQVRPSGGSDMEHSPQGGSSIQSGESSRSVTASRSALTGQSQEDASQSLSKCQRSDEPPPKVREQEQPWMSYLVMEDRQLCEGVQHLPPDIQKQHQPGVYMFDFAANGQTNCGLLTIYRAVAQWKRFTLHPTVTSLKERVIEMFRTEGRGNLSRSGKLMLRKIMEESEEAQ
jgi:hypothetical protein